MIEFRRCSFCSRLTYTYSITERLAERLVYRPTDRHTDRPIERPAGRPIYIFIPNNDEFLEFLGGVSGRR